MVTDSIEASVFVPSDGQYRVCFDHVQCSLRDTLPSYTLTETFVEAIEAAPTWVRLDMEYNLRNLDATQQDRYGGLLLDVAATDPQIVDEVAFQIAHLSRSILRRDSWDEELLRVNASLMYQIDEELQYVEIVDYDLGDGDFYSTTRYRTIVEGDTVEVEIPYEIYYLVDCYAQGLR